ncbi:MAG: hypothetical protein KC419_03295 [Anaerolineales bacterium]|nr:hypothetical protein [Anaerolineales bacterium]MCA9927471.1 hypothetical protein [Anaerolineales bacterium]
MVAQNQKLSLIRRLKGVKEETLVAWLRQAAEHISEVEALLEMNYDLSQSQLNLFRAHVEHYR